MAETKERMDHLRELLENNHEFPGPYTFKFIVPAQRIGQIMAFFTKEDEVSSKASKKGNYISLTVKRQVRNADEVMVVYQSVQVIEGVVTL